MSELNKSLAVKLYVIQARSASGKWKPLAMGYREHDLAKAIAKVRTYDQDGLFSPSYRIVDEDGNVVASYKTHAHGEPK